MGTSRKERTRWGVLPIRLTPLFAAFVTGCLAAILILWRLGALSPAAPSGPPPAPPPSLAERAEALSAMLLPQAEWRRRDGGVPMVWDGRLPAEESLIQWNARVSAGVQALGLEVLEGREEIIHNAGKWPLQRLTLVIGHAGRVVATLMVETTRSPSLPAPF